MNILVVCHYGLYLNFSNSFVHAQAAAYAALGHRVRVIVPIAVGKRAWDGNRFSGSVRRWDQDGVEIYTLRHLSLSNYGKKGFNLACALRALSGNVDKLLEDFAPNIIHAHTLGFDSEIGAWMKERLSVPLVVTSHGSDASIPVEQGRGGELRRYCDKADAVVAVSSALAAKLRSCEIKTPIAVILNGFNLHLLPEASDRSGVCDSAVIQVGHLQKQKRFHITIHAFAKLRAQYPSAVLTLIGKGPDREKLEALCRDLDIINAVRFLGKVPNRNVLEEMSKSRFFVLPSVREGFGIVYLEAMASGCVTIGTEGEGIADLIVSGENGFLVPPDDPDAIVQVVEWCLEHPDEASAIAERGRRDAINLTWEKNALQYLKMFKELLQDGNLGSK